MTNDSKTIKNLKLAALETSINDLERKAAKLPQMPLGEKNTLATPLLEAVYNAIATETGPLIKMAVRRFVWCVEQGAWEESYFEKIKAICMIALRNERLEILVELLPVYVTILKVKRTLNEDAVVTLALIGCLAVKNNQTSICQQCARIMFNVEKITLEDEVFAEIFLDQVRNMLIAAARAKDEGSFVYVLKLVIAFYQENQLITNQQKLKDFIAAILFAVADHRWTKSIYLVDKFLTICITRKTFDVADTKKLVYEWIQLIGQMARRNWPETAQELMSRLFVFVGKTRNTEVISYGITLMGSSFKMHASWDGIEQAFVMYYPWQIAVLVLVDRFIKKPTEKNKEIAKQALRSMRDFAMHVARLTINKSEIKVFLQWFDLWNDVTTSRRVKKRAALMMQLIVLYWEQLQPKSSKNQLPHLMRILQPNLIDEKSRKLLSE